MTAALSLIAVAIWLIIKKSGTEGETYTATIVGITTFDKNYIVEFECDGERIRAETVEGGIANSKEDIGSEIEIEYNKAKPGVCSIKGANRIYFMLAAGVVLVILALARAH